MLRTSTIAAGVMIALAGWAPASAKTELHAASTAPPINLGNVDDITITGVGHATVAIGSPGELRISGPADAVAAIEVTIDDDDELTIGPPPGSGGAVAGAEDVRYDIVVEDLDDVRLSGQISLEIGELAGDELDIELSDSATATIDAVELTELDAELGGTSLLRVAGTTVELDVDGRESAAFDGTALTATNADIEARDSARVVVNVTGELEAEARDTAIIEHVGTPAETEFELDGAGIVRPATGTLLPAAPNGSAANDSTPAESAPIDTAESSPEPATLEISMAGRVFSPAVLEISVGDTVTWTNDDDTEHTVTASGGEFDSGTLAEGATFSFTFDTAGDYTYACLFHSDMQATIVVVG